MVALCRRPELKHARNVAMSQSGSCPSLAQETLPHGVRVFCIRRHLDHLERNFAMQRLVPSAIGDTHRAASKLPERAVFSPLDFEITED